MTYTFDFAPTRMGRYKFRIQIGVILFVGLASAIAVVRSLDLPTNGVAGVADPVNHETIPTFASKSSPVNYVSIIPGTEARSELASIFADRFAFGAAGDAGLPTDIAAPTTEHFTRLSARRHHHRYDRRKTSHHSSERIARSRWELHDLSHLFGFERVSGRR